MNYWDTSCLLKLYVQEPDSHIYLNALRQQSWHSGFHHNNNAGHPTHRLLQNRLERWLYNPEKLGIPFLNSRLRITVRQRLHSFLAGMSVRPFVPVQTVLEPQ